MKKVNLFIVIIINTIILLSCQMGNNNAKIKQPKELSIEDLAKSDLSPGKVARFNHFQKLTETGNAEAEDTLAHLYSAAEGVDMDPDKSDYWFKKSADQGNADALHEMYTTFLLSSEGDEKENIKAAIDYLQKAANKSDPKAEMDLGMEYLSGKHIGQSFSETENWVTKAAKQGNQRAQLFLGRSYLTNEFTVTKDTSKAISWLKKASENKSGSNYSENYIMQADSLLKILEKLK